MSQWHEQSSIAKLFPAAFHPSEESPVGKGPGIFRSAIPVRHSSLQFCTQESLPSVSVVRSIFNGERYLRAALTARPGNLRALLLHAIQAQGKTTMELSVYRKLVGLVGWYRATRWIESVQRLLGRKSGPSTQKQSWMA